MRPISIALVLGMAACGSHGSSNHSDGGNGGDGGGGGGDVPSSNPTTVTVTLNNRPNTPATFNFLVAYQDGSSAWQLAPAPTGDVYSFQVSSPVYGVAWTCISTAGAAGGVETRVVNSAHFAIAERTSLSSDIPNRCTDRVTNVGVTGNVANATTNLFVQLGGGRAAAVNAGNGNFALEAPPGTYDLFVLHAAAAGGVGDFQADQAAVVRGVVVSGPTTQNVDWANAAATQSFAVSVLVPIPGRGQVSTTLYAHGTTARVVADGTNPFETNALAAAQADAADLYDQTMSVSSMGQTETTTNATATPAAETFTAPTPLGGVTSTVPTSTPYPEIKSTWSAYTGTNGYIWTASQTPTVGGCGGGTCTTVWTTLLSPGVTGTSPSYQMPDLSALTGWNAKFALVTGTMVTGSATAMTSTSGAMDFPPIAIPTAGLQRAFARSDYSVTP